MTDRDTILLAEHQRLRSEGVKPGSDEYERTLEAVAKTMQEPRAVIVGDNDTEFFRGTS